MATFKVQVEDITGSVGDDTALSSWLQDGAKEVINFIPKLRLEEVASTSVFENTVDVEGKKVLGVLRKDEDNSNFLTPCVKVAPTKKGIIQDSSNMEYATTSNPAYWVDGDTLQVFPTSASTNDMSLVHISFDFSAVTYDDSSITNFPDEAEPAVVLYATRNALQRLMTDIISNSNITTALTAVKAELDELPAIADLAAAEIVLGKTEAAELATQTDNAGAINTALAAIATELNKVDEIILLAHEEFDEVAAEVSSTATSPITQARAAVPSALSINDLSVNAVLPSVPSLGTVSYSSASATAVGDTTVGNVPGEIDVSSNAPSYTKPTLNLSSVAISDLSISASAPTAHDISTPLVNFGANEPTFTPPDLTIDMAQFSTFLETDEDSELAQVQLGRLNNEVQQYQANIQKEVGNFNRDVQVYQAELQKAIKNAELTSASEAQQMQEYSNDIQLYAQNINKEVQQYQQNTQKELTLYQARTGVELQQYVQDIQNELNEFNKDNTRYQTELQESLAKFNADQQKVITQAQITAADAQQTAQQSTQVAMQNAIQAMQATAQNNANLLTKYASELQVYSASVNNQVQEYAQNLQQKVAEYQSSLAIQGSYYQEAQARVNAGNAFLSQAQSTIAQAQGYASEVGARAAFSGAKGQAVQAYINTAQAYMGEMQSKIGISGGYLQETQGRLAVDTAKYSWYEKQYTMVDARYKEFLQSLQGQQQQRGER